MVHRSKPLEVLYKRYNPLVRSVSSIGLQNQRKNAHKISTYSRFRSRKPPKNPRDLTSSQPKPKKVPSQRDNNLDCSKVPKRTKNVITAFPIFVTKSQFALQRRGSSKSLVVNPSKAKITRQILRRRIKRKRNFLSSGPKYKMITGNKKSPKNKMSKSSMEQIKNMARREDCKSDDGYRGQKDVDENEWEACRNNEYKNTHKKNRDIYGNILGPTPDEAILAGLQTVIEMCSMVDRKPVKKNSIQEVNKQTIMNWVKSEYLLLNEEIRTSTSDLSIENLTERKETLQEIEVLVRKKYELEHKGSELKTGRNIVDVENENLCKSNSRQLSVYYATQPSTISDLDLESLENSNETLNIIRASHSIGKNNSSKNLEINLKPMLLKKNQYVQTICVCDKTTQVMEKQSLSESVGSSQAPEHSIESTEMSLISLVEIKSSIQKIPTSSCGIPLHCCHVAKSTQFTPDLPSACTKSTQFSKTNCKCQKCELSSESSSSSCSSEQSSGPIPRMRSKIVNFFKVYTDRKPPTTTSSTTSVKSSSHPSLKVKSTSDLTIGSIEQPKKLSKSAMVKCTPIQLNITSSIPLVPVKSAFTSTTELKSIEQPNNVIEKLSKSVMDKHTPIKLDITSSTPHIPLISVSTSTTELKPNMMSKNVSFVPEQSTKFGQTVEHKPCLHVEHFTPTTIKPLIPEFDSTHKSIQTSTYDETSAKSSQTIPPSTVCTQSIQIPSKTQSTIDLMSKHAQTPLLGYPCMQSTQTFVESVNTSMEAHSSTLMVQKAVQTKVTFDQPYESSSETTTCVTTTEQTERTSSGTSLEEESSSCDVSSKPTVDTSTFSCGKILTNVTTQCDSISQSNAATDPWSVQIASCQTSLSHCKCIINEYASIATPVCCTPKFPTYQKRVIQMCNANTCPMLQEAMVNISGERSNKRNSARTDKRSYSSSRIQVCNPSTCPMLKSASVNICADLDYQQYKFKEETEAIKTKTKRRIQMCSSRNCRMLKEAIINITNLDAKQQEGDSCDCKTSKLKHMKRKQIHPVLQQAVVNICSIENNPDLFKTLAPKCSCYRENLDDTYITCKEVPVKACAAQDDCFCNYEEGKVEEREVKKTREIESKESDDDTEHEEMLEEEILKKLVENNKVEESETKKETIISIEEIEAPKVKIREISEPGRIELRQKEKVSQESSSSKTVVGNKDKGNSKSSTQRIRQAGQTLKLAIRIPSPGHNLPCGAAWIRKK